MSDRDISMLVSNDQLLDLALLTLIEDKLVSAIGKVCHIDDIAASNELLAQHHSACGIENLQAVGLESINIDDDHVIGRVRVNREVCRAFCNSSLGAGSCHVQDGFNAHTTVRVDFVDRNGSFQTTDTSLVPSPSTIAPPTMVQT